MGYTYSYLCQFNGGCMGCCGCEFVSKEKVKEAIELNTFEYQQLGAIIPEKLVKFRDRAPPSDLRYGVCRNIVQDKASFFCPLHPARNGKHDLRIGHCDADHLCQTAKEFSLWSQEKQEEFIRFIQEKNLDSLDYSLKIDDSSLLKEFESSEQIAAEGNFKARGQQNQNI